MTFRLFSMVLLRAVRAEASVGLCICTNHVKWGSAERNPRFLRKAEHLPHNYDTCCPIRSTSSGEVTSYYET